MEWIFDKLIGERVILNESALKFSRDCIIVNSGLLKSRRRGTFVGYPKHSKKYLLILWDGNKKPQPERPEFISVLKLNMCNLSQFGSQC